MTPQTVTWNSPALGGSTDSRPPSGKPESEEWITQQWRANYNQLQQNNLNNYFQAKVRKELPIQFPEPLSVGKLDVGNFALSNTANALQAKIT